MSWPSLGDYAQALQNPALAFREAHLKQAEFRKNRINTPLGLPGNFAVVFPATDSRANPIAVRTFTGPNDDRNHRYDAVSTHFDTLKRKQRLPSSLVDFKYYREGVKANRTWWPLVTMEWVSGSVLYDWVKGECLARRQANLTTSAERWRALVGGLVQSDIAHGDLQHGNVIVTPAGEMKLVDYDCMCVPALVGQPNLELGVEPYQHPERGAKTLLSFQLDNFSGIFIYVVLRALAAAPNLWDTYVEASEYEKLLIRADDFKDPGGSKLFRDLRQSPDAQVQRLSGTLFELYRAKLKDVPQLDAVLIDSKKVQLLVQGKKWDDLVAMFHTRDATKDLPADLKPLQPKIIEAFDRVDCRKALEKKVDQGDEPGMVRHYDRKLLDDYPEAQPAVREAKLAPQVIPALQQLGDLKRQALWRKFVATWDAQLTLLDKRKSAQPFRAEAHQWREKNRLCDELLNLLQPAEPDAARVRAAWEAMQKTGIHPEAEPKRNEVQHLLLRDDHWKKLTVALAQRTTPGSEGQDRAIVAAWVDALFRNWKPAESRISEVKASSIRLNSVKSLAGLNGAAPSLAGEQRIVEIADRELPPGYQHHQAPRVQAARMRIQVVAEFQKAIVEPALESRIAVAGDRVKAVQAEALLAKAEADRLAIARRRVPLLETLRREVPNGCPADERDKRILIHWRDELRPCHEARPWAQWRDEAARRRELLTELERALHEKDDAAIDRLLSEPLLQGYPLSTQSAQTLSQWQDRIAIAQDLVQALQSRNREAFREKFDARVIRDYASRFEKFQQQLVEWTREEIMPLSRLGLSKLAVGKPVILENEKAGKYLVQWQWPRKDYAESCMVGMVARSPAPDLTPGDLPEEDVSNVPNWGGQKTLYPEKNHKFVVVWTIVDLGFTRLVSEPLLLGSFLVSTPQGAPGAGKKPAAKRGGWFS